MAFTPLARVRNFSEKYLSEFINLYPNIMYDSAWCDAADSIDQEMKGYKRTYYQQACQLGIEDRSDDKKFQYHVYLEMFDSENLKKYMEFWFKIYHAPNPYVKGNENDLPVLLYCEFAKKILESSTLSIHFKEVDIQICGTDASGDILLNCFKSYGAPIKFRKDEETKDSKADGILFVELGDKKRLQELVRFIEREFPIPNDNTKKAFYDRFSYDNFNKFWAVTGQPYNKHCEVVKDSRIEFYRNESNRIQGGENIVLYGVPGSGKSYQIATKYCNNTQYMERVVFHPDYTYSDFIGQILPKIENDVVCYRFAAGPFTKIMERAWRDPFHMYYLIIEELNRGNAPAIFGDIFQLLDRSANGWGEYHISNADMSSYIFPDEEKEKPIQIPSNLSILATMNTSDQNVFTLDNAFQRRWKMRLIHNNFNKNGNERHDAHIAHVIAGSSITWGAFAFIINGQIAKISKESLGSEDKRLGVFFATDAELDDKEDFAEKVLKYLWDDAFKMDRGQIFQDSFDSFESVIDAYLEADGDPLKAVLVGDIYAGMDPKMNG